jgi:HEAT repeat protein
LVKAWKSSPNFVWSAPMLEVVTTNSTTSALVRLVLPRVLALAAKWTGSDEKKSDVTFKSSPVARALSCCITHPNAVTVDSEAIPPIVAKANPRRRKKAKLSLPPPSYAIASTTKSVLNYQPKVAPDLAEALWSHVNDRANQSAELVASFNATRQAREQDGIPGAASSSTTAATNTAALKGQGSPTDSHWGMDTNAVRRVAFHPLGTSLHNSGRSTTPRALAQVLLLMHMGSSLRDEGHQRNNLRKSTLQVLKAVNQYSGDRKFTSVLAMYIAECAAQSEFQWDAADKEDKKEGLFAVSETVHRAALSLMISLGGIAAAYLLEEEMGMEDENSEGEEKDKEELKASEFASILCTKEIPMRLNECLTRARDQVEALSEEEVGLLLSPAGTLFGASNGEIDDSGGKSIGASKGRKKGGGFNAKEDEEWEEQLKKEIAEKRKKEKAESGGNGGSKQAQLSPEDQKKVAQQDQQRKKLSTIVHGDFARSLAAIRYLCVSDIEVGNACLPLLHEAVLSSAVSECETLRAVRRLQEKAFQTLVSLAASVYEIHEDNAIMLALALTISCRTKANNRNATKKEGAGPLLRKDSNKEDDSILTVLALPSPCPSAECAITEMEQFHGPLCGNSFVFLFPIVRAALMGPRTSQGCEAALRILEWHTSLLAGDEADPVVAPLRKNMVVSVLELMKHDRAQTFLDPTPNDTLVACFRTEADSSGGPALSTAELAPLLDDRGALGGRACRAGAMIALRHIASEHEGLIKKNPLIENRIWLNCFDKNETIRSEARKAWTAIHGGEMASSTEEEVSTIKTPPSLMYAAPLLPLLSHQDESIAQAAADAYARGMAMHPKSVDRNIQKLCNSYIEAFPTLTDESKKGASLPAALPPKKAPVAPAKKPVASLGLPKKKTTVKKSPLSVAGIGKPVVKKKKSSAVASALLKPKQERTLDQDTLASQFQAGPVQTKEETKDAPEKIAVRLGILQAVTALTNAEDLQMDIPTLKMLTSFLMAYGIAEIDETVKSSARNTLRDVVASNGSSDEAIAFLLPHLEDVLKSGMISDEAALSSLSTEKVPRDVDACDRRKEGAVVALGSVALHLKGPENASKIDNTIDMLIATLKTPSEDVQSSVAECLAKLMKKGNTQERVETILSGLLKECLHGETLASRRGAAYGISAVVKGSGIATLKKYEIVKKLEEACSSGGSNSKEGSLFAIELLSVRLGLLFEPYVIVLLPSLLKAFSDSSDYVRKAASDTCGLIMSKLSAHGVKLVMPAVLTAFNDPAWRTKQASIRMLGAMSHLAPKQLASALPKVVPQLTEAFGDTHPKVKASAQEALDEISTVIRNPEISSISALLLKALTDPADHTTKALEGLIETEFLHAIDAPSLALIVPILHRGLRDRGATTKRYGALIAGNICTMINDSRDFVPYLPTLLPDLKAALLDPIPDVRSTAAKALGSLTRGLGDSILADLRPWLIERLGDEKCSSAERSGAANGMTEVLVAAGTVAVEDAMHNEILPLRSHPSASTREGVLWMLTYLPSTLGQGFTPLMDESVGALIGGLSDESESVREVAMRAGRVLIRSHGKVHVDKILPSLEAGLIDDDYRIRLASLTLLGDLLSTIGGTTVLTGDGDTREDIRRAERAQAQIALTLGSEKRKRVLSGLYLARSDNTSVVRHHAIQVWKTVVSVTARTLKDILSVLIGQVVEGLASGDAERTLVAGRCLGEIVTKLGDSVLPEIIPVLRNSLYEGDNHTKRGVCIGLSEVIKCSTKEQILRFIDIIVKLVQDALCDEDEQVCKMAASSFQSLYFVVGNRALDEVVPSLMVALETSYDEQSRIRALNGLTGIMRVRSRDLLPYVVPRLLHKPVTKSHAEALTGIAKVTGETIHNHFTSIIPVLLNELANLDPSEEEDSGREEAIRESMRSLSASVEEGGLNVLISEVASKCSSDKPEMRVASCWMFEVALIERKFFATKYFSIYVLFPFGR